MKPIGSPRTPCIKLERGFKLAPRRTLANAAAHAKVVLNNVGCKGPSSRFSSHRGFRPKTELKIPESLKSSGFSGYRISERTKSDTPETENSNRRVVFEGSRVIQIFIIRCFVRNTISYASLYTLSIHKIRVSAIENASGSKSLSSSSELPPLCPSPPPPTPPSPLSLCLIDCVRAPILLCIPLFLSNPGTPFLSMRKNLLCCLLLLLMFVDVLPESVLKIFCDRTLAFSSSKSACFLFEALLVLGKPILSLRMILLSFVAPIFFAPGSRIDGGNRVSSAIFLFKSRASRLDVCDS
mmetsp:Transcript_8306/g.26563  ORF Transcript_8306/g.26563 Transcript_8306/m.26563 type:complete len:296 (+) Transcript_8306:2023-2910(+)